MVDLGLSQKHTKMKFKKNPVVPLLDTKAGEEHWHICPGAAKEATRLSVPSPERHLFLLCSFEARLDEARLFGNSRCCRNRTCDLWWCFFLQQSRNESYNSFLWHDGLRPTDRIKFSLKTLVIPLLYDLNGECLDPIIATSTALNASTNDWWSARPSTQPSRSPLCPTNSLPPSFKTAATVNNHGFVMDKERVPMPELKQTSGDCPRRGDQLAATKVSCGVFWSAKMREFGSSNEKRGVATLLWFACML